MGRSNILDMFSKTFLKAASAIAFRSINFRITLQLLRVCYIKTAKISFNQLGELVDTNLHKSTQPAFSTLSFVTLGHHLGSNATFNTMIMGLNFHWQGTWTKAVCTEGGGQVCECTVECTLGCDSAQYIQDKAMG